MTHLVTIRHNFETAHRLPHLPGKCQSLHGHSWWAEVTVAASELSRGGLVVEFGALKKEVAGDILFDLVRAPGAYISRVHVTETHVNGATWEAPCPAEASA
jgi:6-pyruvoyltetrahydropterin/6-carboxytetrahydropterin synthase